VERHEVGVAVYLLLSLEEREVSLRKRFTFFGSVPKYLKK
jgi:hypothetical protein